MVIRTLQGDPDEEFKIKLDPLNLRRWKPNRDSKFLTFLWMNLEYSGRPDDVIKWKHFPCYWPFVRGIHRSPVNSPHKGQWRGALMFSLICAWINAWVNNHEAGDLRRHHAHYNVTVMVNLMFADALETQSWYWICRINGSFFHTKRYQLTLLLPLSISSVGVLSLFILWFGFIR